MIKYKYSRKCLENILKEGIKMLLKVRQIPTQIVYTVYSVKQNENAEACEFLVFDSIEAKWKWLSASECVSV